MAEARSAISYHHVDRSHLLFQVTEEEVIVRINKSLLPAFASSLRRSFFRLAVRTRNRIINALHPAPPLHWALLIYAPASLMLSPPSSHPRLLTLSSALWRLRSLLPFAGATPILSPEHTHVAQALMIAAGVGTAVALTLSALRRMMLRALFSYQGWIYDPPGRMSLGTRLWGICVHVVSGLHPFRLFRARRPLLYSSQPTLPRLPVPRLRETLHKYLLSVQPILSSEEFQLFQRLADEFQQKEGKKLQRYLILKSWVSRNYVSDWWEKYVYLRGRTPLLINSNYYALDSGTPSPPTPHQASRAASLISHLLKFKEDIDHERLEPMSLRGMVPISMSQYERMFGTTRIPGKEVDRIVHFDADASLSVYAGHVAVFRKGIYYVMSVYDDAGKALSANELEVQLKWILNDAEKASKEQSEAEKKVTSLTTEERTTWAKVREEFFSEGINRASLDAIEKSLFCVYLDDVILSPTDWAGQGRQLLHGNGWNRWCDKSFCLVVFPNGKAGLHVEHSWADAPVIGHLWEDCVISDSQGLYDPNGSILRLAPVLPRPPPRRLKWNLSAKAEEAIHVAAQRAEALIGDLDLEIMRYQGFGKGKIKGKGISPDGFVQMAMLLASKRAIGLFPLTYESAMARLFRDGRTETIRPVTLEATQFVNAFLNPSISKEEKIQLLKRAGKRHQEQSRDCMVGKGVDRHLFALFVVSQGLGVDSPFLMKALNMDWRVSSSQQPQGQTGKWDPSQDPEKISPGGGFGPVCDHGYGVSYNLAGETQLYFHISSKRSSPETDSARYGREISRALDEIMDLFSLDQQQILPNGL